MTYAGAWLLVAGLLAPGAIVLGASCAGGVARPARAGHVQADFQPVPRPPPPPKAEWVPGDSQRGGIWVPGEWHWSGQNWQWQAGSFITPPAGAKLAPWKLRRDADGRLLHAPSTWVFDNGWRAPVHVAHQPAAPRLPCTGSAPDKPAFRDIDPQPP